GGCAAVASRPITASRTPHPPHVPPPAGASKHAMPCGGRRRASRPLRSRGRRSLLGLGAIPQRILLGEGLAGEGLAAFRGKRLHAPEAALELRVRMAQRA